jgi:TolB-like protein/Tfp pilus assembly protein PilF
VIELLDRLRHRKLVQWALAYAAVAWVLLQVLGLMSESFEWPRVVMRVAFGAALLGFAVAIVLAWYHGERGEQDISATELVIVSVLLAMGGALLWRSNSHSSPTPAPVASVAAPRQSATRRPDAPAKSIAVLPFENLSKDPADAYLADGLQEEILNALARLRDMKVISRTSVMEYRGHDQNIREIGERLGARTILEGSVRREGDTLRLTVQLIDARNDRHLLAANYDRKLDNVLGLQTEVARLVAKALDATISNYERGDLDRVATNSGDAYDRYLHAVALFRIPVPGDDLGIVEPRRQLQEALDIDPDFVDALALLSTVDTWMYYNGGKEPELERAARQSLERALALDPKSAEARLARGIYATYISKDLGQAISDLESVVSLRPNSAEAHALLGLALRRRGRTVEALEHFQRAWDLDPLKGPYASDVVTTLLGLRRYPEALEQASVAVSRLPDHGIPYFVRARLLARAQHSMEPLRVALRDHGVLLDPASRKSVDAEIAEGEGRYLDAIRLWGEVPVDNTPLLRAKRLGLLYLAVGDVARARQELQRGERMAKEQAESSPMDSDPENLAIVQSLLGEHSAAMATIERARSEFPENNDALNGPRISFLRSIVLVRAGRRDEGYAEAERLLHVPFGAPINDIFGPEDTWQLLPEAKDPHFDALINHPPRL